MDTHLKHMSQAQEHPAIAVVLEGEQVHALGQASIIREERGVLATGLQSSTCAAGLAKG